MSETKTHYSVGGGELDSHALSTPVAAYKDGKWLVGRQTVATVAERDAAVIAYLAACNNELRWALEQVIVCASGEDASFSAVRSMARHALDNSFTPPSGAERRAKPTDATES